MTEYERGFIDGVKSKVTAELTPVITKMAGGLNQTIQEAVKTVIGNVKITAKEPSTDVQPVYYAENVQNEVLNYLFNKEREAESMSYGDKRQERIVTIREIIRFVEDIDPRMDGDTD